MKIKKVLRILLKSIAIMIFIVLLMVAAIAGYIGWFANPSFETSVAELKVETTPERLLIGEKIASNYCMSCHYSDQGTLSGRILMNHKKWGFITTANLTRHPDSNVSSCSDGELFVLLKTGIKKDKHMALPMMPRLSKISDEDLLSLIAFLRSDHPLVSSTSNDLPPSELGFFLKGLMKFVIRPLENRENVALASNADDLLQYGSYLVNGRYSCYECHSRSTSKINLVDPTLSEGYLGGGSNLLVYGNTFGIRSANITPHDAFGIGTWSYTDFAKAVTTGIRPDGKTLRPPMNRMKLDSIELNAIYVYLRSVPPIAHEWPYESRLQDSK